MSITRESASDSRVHGIKFIIKESSDYAQRIITKVSRKSRGKSSRPITRDISR